jgi:hypothetical protein
MVKPICSQSLPADDAGKIGSPHYSIQNPGFLLARWPVSYVSKEITKQTGCFRPKAVACAPAVECSLL